MAAARVKELARAWVLARRNRRAGKSSLLEDRLDPKALPLKAGHREEEAVPILEVLRTPRKAWAREQAAPAMAAARVKELARAWALARRNRRVDKAIRQ